jgi:hypothetical protein
MSIPYTLENLDIANQKALITWGIEVPYGRRTACDNYFSCPNILGHLHNFLGRSSPHNRICFESVHLRMTGTVHCDLPSTMRTFLSTNSKAIALSFLLTFCRLTVGVSNEIKIFTSSIPHLLSGHYECSSYVAIFDEAFSVRQP